VSKTVIRSMTAQLKASVDPPTSLELAGFVLGEQKGLHGSVLDFHTVSESTCLVEESVYGVDVDVPLVDGCFGIGLRGVAGDGVDYADISGLAAVFGGRPCCGSADDSSESKDLGCGREMHIRFVKCLSWTEEIESWSWWLWG
jgi:hypothetical protein